MEKIVLDTAIKFGAGRYRQEQGLLEQCGEEVKRFGKKATSLQVRARLQQSKSV